MQPVRAQGDGTLGPVTHRYRRKDGTLVEATYWRAAVTVDGKRVYRSAKTKAEGKALLAELLRQRDARTVDGSRLRLRTYLEGWLDDVRPNLAPATWRKHEQHIRNHIIPSLGHRRLSELSVRDVRNWLAGSRTVGPQTLRHHRATLRRALADAVRDGLLARNVAALAEPPKLDTKERPVLTAQEVRVLIDGTRDHPYGALFTLLATTGLREAEALALTWEDIDLDDTVRLGERGREADLRPAGSDRHGAPIGVDQRVADGHGGVRPLGHGGDVAGGLRDRAPSVRVTRTLHRIPRSGDTPGSWEFRTTKTAKSKRTVFLPAVTVEALRRHKAAQMKAWLADGRPGDGQMVFTDTKGRPVHGSKLTEILYPVLDGLGLPRVTVHDLRHSAATILYGAGVPLEAIADMLGHSTTRVTSDLYRHRVEQVQRGAADAMEVAVG